MNSIRTAIYLQASSSGASPALDQLLDLSLVGAIGDGMEGYARSVLTLQPLDHFFDNAHLLILIRRLRRCDRCADSSMLCDNCAKPNHC